MCYSVNVIFTVKIVTLTTNLQLQTTCQLVTFLILYLITSNYCFYLLNFYSIFITAQRNDSKSGLHMFVIWLIIRTCSWIRSVTTVFMLRKYILQSNGSKLFIITRKDNQSDDRTVTIRQPQEDWFISDPVLRRCVGTLYIVAGGTKFKVSHAFMHSRKPQHILSTIF